MSRLTRWLESRRAGPVDGAVAKPKKADPGRSAPEISRAAVDQFVAAQRQTDPELDRFMGMMERKLFVDDQGNEEPITIFGLDYQSVGTLYYLACAVKPTNSIETGFGLGTSALTIMLAKRGIADQKHTAIDPYGLAHHGVGDVGMSVCRYLERTYGARFERAWQPSEI